MGRAIETRQAYHARHSGARAQRGSPESITPGSECIAGPMVMDSGLAAFAAPRNDTTVETLALTRARRFHEPALGKGVTRGRPAFHTTPVLWSRSAPRIHRHPVRHLRRHHLGQAQPGHRGA